MPGRKGGIPNILVCPVPSVCIEHNGVSNIWNYRHLSFPYFPVPWPFSGYCLVLMDFLVLNVFTEILKVKKDGHETLVYIRQDKILLMQKTLKLVKFWLVTILYFLPAYVFLVFGVIALIDYSYECESGKDCFLWSSIAADRARANCSDPD